MTYSKTSWNYLVGKVCNKLYTMIYNIYHQFILITLPFSNGFQAKVWDISRCHLLTTLIGHNAAIFAVDMSEDGSLVITGSADRVSQPQH